MKLLSGKPLVETVLVLPPVNQDSQRCGISRQKHHIEGQAGWSSKDVEFCWLGRLLGRFFDTIIKVA